MYFIFHFIYCGASHFLYPESGMCTVLRFCEVHMNLLIPYKDKHCFVSKVNKVLN